MGFPTRTDFWPGLGRFQSGAGKGKSGAQLAGWFGTIFEFSRNGLALIAPWMVFVLWKIPI